MKKISIIFLLFVLLLSCACTKPPQEAPVSIPQTDIKKAPNYGSIFARTPDGDFYSRTDGEKTYLTCRSGHGATEVAVLDGTWRFSLCKPTEAYDYLLFDGYRESEQGYRGSVFMYVKKTQTFTAFFDAPTSNAIILPTDDENHADLAWVLLQADEGASLVPINLRDGTTQMGQIVSFAQTDYAAESENILPVLKISDDTPLQIRIENKTYEGSSVLSTVSYIYDFEENKLTKMTEEEE